MAIKTRAVTVATTATQLAADDAERVRRMLIHNNSAQIVYIGPAAVTVADGYPIPVNGTLELTEDLDDVYAIVAATTASIRILEDF